MFQCGKPIGQGGDGVDDDILFMVGGSSRLDVVGALGRLTQSISLGFQMHDLFGGVTLSAFALLVETIYLSGALVGLADRHLALGLRGLKSGSRVVGSLLRSELRILCGTQLDLLLVDTAHESCGSYRVRLFTRGSKSGDLGCKFCVLRTSGIRHCKCFDPLLVRGSALIFRRSEALRRIRVVIPCEPQPTQL